MEIQSVFGERAGLSVSSYSKNLLPELGDPLRVDELIAVNPRRFIQNSSLPDFITPVTGRKR